MNTVSGIKKVSKTKHVNVDDQTKEIQIDVHTNKSIDQNNDKEKTIISQTTTKTKTEFDLKDVRIIFMGTGIFAGNMLEEIKKHASLKNMHIITQPDKKIGRKKSSIHRTLAANPVREFAIKNDVPLLQPYTLDNEAIAKIKDLRPDIIIVSAYGKILPEEILKLPRFGALNVHASLLPKLRGASPVQNALLIGLKKTGVTIMKMDNGLDTGDILAQKKVKIKEHEKADELLERLSRVGATLLTKTVYA
ncbi:MAG TPA: methionyl-tRNA formyltransferase, partial [Candidatus Pacebacteria bacterium]|nr:methionyl-tRNA formyltransferase [Candidatus Paceibacterota bacterium]